MAPIEENHERLLDGRIFPRSGAPWSRSVPRRAITAMTGRSVSLCDTLADEVEAEAPEEKRTSMSAICCADRDEEIARSKPTRIGRSTKSSRSWATSRFPAIPCACICKRSAAIPS